MTIEPRNPILTHGVRNGQASYDYYSKILGFPSVNGIEGDIMFFTLNHALLAVCPRDQLADDACIHEASGRFSGITLVQTVKLISKVDEIIENLREPGVKIAKETQHIFWGGYDAYLQDPDDHLWKVTWIPKSWLKSHTNREL